MKERQEKDAIFVCPFCGAKDADVMVEYLARIREYHHDFKFTSDIPTISSKVEQEQLEEIDSSFIVKCGICLGVLKTGEDEYGIIEHLKEKVK